MHRKGRVISSGGPGANGLWQASLAASFRNSVSMRASAEVIPEASGLLKGLQSVGLGFQTSGLKALPRVRVTVALRSPLARVSAERWGWCSGHTWATIGTLRNNKDDLKGDRRTCLAR